MTFHVTPVNSEVGFWVADFSLGRVQLAILPSFTLKSVDEDYHNV